CVHFVVLLFPLRLCASVLKRKASRRQRSLSCQLSEFFSKLHSCCFSPCPPPPKKTFPASPSSRPSGVTTPTQTFWPRASSRATRSMAKASFPSSSSLAP